MNDTVTARTQPRMTQMTLEPSAMPGAEEDEIVRLREAFREMPSTSVVSSMLFEDKQFSTSHGKPVHSSYWSTSTVAWKASVASVSHASQAVSLLEHDETLLAPSPLVVLCARACLVPGEDQRTDRQPPVRGVCLSGFGLCFPNPPRVLSSQ